MLLDHTLGGLKLVSEFHLQIERPRVYAGNIHPVPYRFCLDAGCLPSQGWWPTFPGAHFLFHKVYCAKLLACQPLSYLTGVTGVPPFPLCLEELTVGYCQQPYVTYFVTQKENFNKASKGSAAIFRGKASYEQVHGDSQEAAVAASPAEREQCHPILSLSCLHSPSMILTGCSSLL